MAAASRRRHIDISAHLTPDELALLAEGKAGEAAEKFRSHLAHCKSCFEAYQEAVEFHARALAGKEPHAPPELVQNGRNVPVRRGKTKGVTRAPRGRMILATLGGLVALAAVWIFLGPSGSHGPRPKSVLTAENVVALAQVSGQASQQGSIVYPDALWGESEQPLRGEGSLSSDLGLIIEQLQELAKERKISPHDLFWLISAELATGNLDMARVHLRDAPTDSDIRFLKLHAILAYKESNLTVAEGDLRHILGTNPNDSESELNLGILLLEKGQTPQAIELLQQARQSGKSPEIAQRAGQILDSMSETKSR